MKKIISFLTLLFSLSLVGMEIDQPTESKSNKIKWGLSVRQGKRPEMEDTHCHITDFDNDPQQAFFAIYDGHGGNWVAQHLRDQLHKEFLRIKKEKPQYPIEVLLTKTFENMDNDICWQSEMYKNIKIGQYHTNFTGSTAAVVYINNNNLCMAWAGDSRIAVIRNGIVITETSDHKPTAPSEQVRLLQKGYAPVNKKIEGYAVSRAFGDWLAKSIANKYAKYDADNWPTQHFYDVVFTAKPEIKKLQVMPGDTIVIACDGLWDVFSSFSVAQGLKSKINNVKTISNEIIEDDGDIDLMNKARSLRNLAYDCGSSDNISVMLIQIPGQSNEQKREKSHKNISVQQQTKFKQDILRKLGEFKRSFKSPEIQAEVKDIMNPIVQIINSPNELNFICDEIIFFIQDTELASGFKEEFITFIESIKKQLEE